MAWTDLLALVTFGVAGSGSPGPNNTLLLASGIRFGFRKTVPHVLGAAAGVGALVLAVAAGVGALIDAVPGSQTVLKVVGSLYLVYLAGRLLSSRPIEQDSAARPLAAWEAAAFQFVNPKAWVFALAVVGAFLPDALPAFAGGALVAGVQTCVASLTFASWALGGVALSRLITHQRTALVVNMALAMLLLASIVLLWV